MYTTKDTTSLDMTTSFLSKMTQILSAEFVQRHCLISNRIVLYHIVFLNDTPLFMISLVHTSADCQNVFLHRKGI